MKILQKSSEAFIGTHFVGDRCKRIDCVTFLEDTLFQKKSEIIKFLIVLLYYIL